MNLRREIPLLRLIIIGSSLAPPFHRGVKPVFTLKHVSRTWKSGL
jgi:hypothetical protein